MGTTLREIATGSGRGVEGLRTFDARFRRLLACSNAIEVCDHLTGVLRAAERQGVGINFIQLFDDLSYWSDRIKVKWAREYWAAMASDSDQSETTPESDEEEA